MEPTTESLSAIVNDRGENGSPAIFSSTPPSGRTRAQLKPRNEEHCFGKKKELSKDTIRFEQFRFSSSDRSFMRILSSFLLFFLNISC